MGQKYGKAIDIWAVGCTLFEMMMLAHAFQGRDNAQILQNIVWARHADVDPNWSSSLSAILKSMLALKPEVTARPLTKLAETAGLASGIFQKNPQVAASHGFSESCATRRAQIRPDACEIIKDPICEHDRREQTRGGGKHSAVGCTRTHGDPAHLPPAMASDVCDLTANYMIVILLQLRQCYIRARFTPTRCVTNKSSRAWPSQRAPPACRKSSGRMPCALRPRLRSTRRLASQAPRTTTPRASSAVPARPDFAARCAHARRKKLPR